MERLISVTDVECIFGGILYLLWNLKLRVRSFELRLALGRDLVAATSGILVGLVQEGHIVLVASHDGRCMIR
jgi:hypothetical protein